MDRIEADQSYHAQKAYQDGVKEWMLACFGEAISADQRERNHRFLEEALELVQSTGCTNSEAHQLVEYVFGRPIGEPHQEVGGVMVTLAALCEANKIDMGNAAHTELARVWTKVEAIRAKHARKPKMSPLPGASDVTNTAPPYPGIRPGDQINAPTVGELVPIIYGDAAATPPYPGITNAVEMEVARTRSRMQCSVDACLERHGGDEKAATTNVGIAVGYLFGGDIVQALEHAETEITRLRRVIERDRSRVSEIYSSIKSLMAGRRWLTMGRGNYEWNDDRYKDEFSWALADLEEAVKPLRKIAGDLTDAPVDTDQIKLARAGE